jgi:hypothetical protein
VAPFSPAQPGFSYVARKFISSLQIGNFIDGEILEKTIQNEER